MRVYQVLTAFAAALLIAATSYDVTETKSMSQAQVGGGFASFAAQHCDGAIGQVERIRVRKCPVGADMRYCTECVSTVEKPLAALKDLLNEAKTDPGVKVRTNGVSGGKVTAEVRRRSIVDVSDAASFFASFGTPHCTWGVDDVQMVVVTRTDPQLSLPDFDVACYARGSGDDGDVLDLVGDASTDESLTVRLRGD